MLSKRSQTIIRWAVPISAALFVANLAHFWISGSKVGAQVPTAYTVTLTQTFIDKTGGAHYANTETYAVASNGSNLWKYSSPQGNAAPDAFRTIFYSSGKTVQIRDVAQVTNTITRPKPVLRSASASCISGPSETLSGTEDVASYRSAKVTNGSRINWYALDHGCALVKSHVAWDNGSSTEKALLSLVDGEPDPAMFFIPATYKEVLPSAWHHPTGLTGLSASELSLMGKLDAQYQAANH